VLNSIGIPQIGPAPPPDRGAVFEHGHSAETRGFAAVLADASHPAKQAESRRDVGLEGAPTIDGGAPLESAPRAEGETKPAVVGLPLQAIAAGSLTGIDRPDRSSEAEVTDIEQTAKLEVGSPDPQGSPLAALLGLVTPPAPPAAPVAPTLLEGVTAIETSPASEVASTNLPQTEATSVSGAQTGGSPPEDPPPTAQADQPDQPAANQGPRAHERPEASRAPEERLGEQLQAIDPKDRSEFASEWNRAGGHFGGGSEGEHPSRPAQAAIPATPAQPKDGTPAVPSTGNKPRAETAIEAIDGGEGTRSERPSTARLEDTRPHTRQSASEVDTATPGDSAAQAASGAVSDRPAEVPTSRPEQSAPPLEARDAAALQRGLTDSVHAAVRRSASNGNETVRLLLNPPDLGHLDIHVTTGKDGVRVEVAASTSGATDLIRQHLPALVSGLEARDLRVDRAEVRHALNAQLGTDLGGRDPRSSFRQPEDRGADGAPRWARPEWSGVAALERAADRAATRRSEQASTRLLDLVA
jgi:flagellar hook-length control protein FliK